MSEGRREFNLRNKARYLIKTIRKLLKLKKTPKKSGYNRLFSEEEQRLTIESVRLFCC